MSRSRWDTFGYRIATLLNAETEERAGVLLKRALRHFAHAARARHASVIFLGSDRLPLRCVDSSTDQDLPACNQLSFKPQDLDVLPDEGFVEEDLSTTGDPLWVRTMPLPPSPYTALLFLHGPADGDREMIRAYSGLLVAFLKRYGSELPASPSLAEAMTQAMTELAHSLDREQILDRALSQLEQLVPHDASDVMLRDGPVVRVARHQGYDQFVSAHVARSLTIRLDLKLFQRMIQTHTPIVVGDTTSNPEWVQIEAMDWIRSYAAAPIVIEDHVIGFINLYSRQPGFFAPYHTRNLQAFAHYIAVAIQNARLYERARQRTEESAALNAKLQQREQHLRSLNTLTSALNRTGNPNEILQLGLDQALQVTGMHQGAIYLRDPQTRTMVRQVQRHSQESLPAPTTQHEAVQRALREKQLVIADVRAADVRDTDAGEGSGLPQSLIAAPLTLGKEAIGVMVLSTTQSQPPTNGMTELLRAIVDQLAFAAQRGRQASQVRDQLSTAHTLYEISTAFLSQMNTGGVAFLLTRTLTDNIPQAMGAALYQEQEESGTWSRIRVYVPDPGSPLKAQWREGKTWAGEDLFLSLCKQKREQLFLSQGRTEALPVLKTFQSEDRQPTMLYIPLVLPNRTVWGIVALMLEDSEHALQGYSATLLRAIVQQGTAAITRATLYEESQTNESQMHAILESSRDGVVLVGDNQEIRYVNGQALKLLHIPTSPATWVDQPLDAFHRALRTEAPDLYHWLEDIADPIDLQGGIGDDQAPPPPDFETLHGRILNLQRWPVHSDQGHILGSLYLIRNVTEQRELERMREDFFHMLVHDLRNPLSNIKNALLFIADPMMADMADELVDIAQTNADRILNLVNAILEIGKLEAQQIHLEREPVVLGPLVERTAQDLMLGQQPFDFEAIVPGGVPKVWADPSILVRILDNLLSNAKKFAPDGGIVRITATVPGDEETVRISIYNNGPHFGPEVESHLFQKFSTGDYESQGYGLGLAFCRLAVEAHGGEIDAANEPEGGVTFTFTLPVYRAQDLVQDIFLSNLKDFDLDG